MSEFRKGDLFNYYETDIEIIFFKWEDSTKFSTQRRALGYDVKNRIRDYWHERSFGEDRFTKTGNIGKLGLLLLGVEDV